MIVKISEKLIVDAIGAEWKPNQTGVNTLYVYTNILSFDSDKVTTSIVFAVDAMYEDSVWREFGMAAENLDDLDDLEEFND